MALVFIPAAMQTLTQGMSQVRVAGRTVRAVLNHLETRFPGIKERLLQGGELRPDMAIAVDGEIIFDLTEPLADDSEVHFVPPIRGG
jgi:molybdopterin synthase sulfur carrier subunit